MKPGIFTACVATLSGTALAASSTGSAEVDLVFPRNVTYKPMPLMPVVFAVKKPDLLNLVYPSLHYILTKVGDANATTEYHELHIRRLAGTGNDTDYLYEGVANLVSVEAQWKLQWDLRWVNCSTDANGTDYASDDTPEDYRGFHRRTQWPHHSLVFSTDNSGRQPDLGASAEKDAGCDNSQGFAFDIIDNLDVPEKPSLDADGVTLCALLASPAPTPTPCKASIDPEHISSIEAKITHAECGSATPAVTCPADKSASGRMQSPRAWVAISAAVFAFMVL